MKAKEKHVSAEKTADSVSLVKPSAATLLVIKAVLKPWQDLLNPSFEGIERIPDEKPLLFVGNHTLFGVLDIPFVFDADGTVGIGYYGRVAVELAQFQQLRL